jgi:hypothetical protein
MRSRKRHRREPTDDPNGEAVHGDPAETGAFIYTFAFRLPFRMGISDSFGQEISWPAEYANAEDAQTFAKPPFVRLRLFNATVSDRKFSPANAPLAVRHFYEAEYDPGPADDKVDPRLYEQWVSLETPAALLIDENRADGAYAFHRCLSGLNVYLQAFALAREDDQVRPISSRELRPIVIVGSLSLTGTWSLRGPILMHPDAKDRPLRSRPAAEHAESLNRAMRTMLLGNPFVRSWQWKARGERRRYEGDGADAVVSFQIAAEAFLFEIWALLLADEGRTAVEVADLRRTTSFASLVKTELSQRLGGSWDTTRPRTSVGHYWRDLYELRTRVVHAGYLPHDGDAEKAERAFEGLEGFVRERLQTRAKRYPTAVGALQQLADVTGSG